MTRRSARLILWRLVLACGFCPEEWQLGLAESMLAHADYTEAEVEEFLATSGADQWDNRA